MDMDRYIGRLLDGRYEILKVIGTGGMAVVYEARCHRLNRLVAIKILKDELTQDEEFRRRFHAESQAVAMLSHPNIVSVYDVSTTSDADYIVMELIDGISLKQYMEKKGVLNWKETLHFAIQIAKALDHAHSRGIIHRDIKPHNVMVLKNGSVKVADFGIAQVMSKSNTLTKEALGSVHYISPEQAKGARVDNRSDLYSLGIVMYEMMAGRPPYDGDSPVAVAIQHINGGAAMPSTLNPNIPGGLEQIIMKAMAQDITKRYATAKALLTDMDEFRKDPTILFDFDGNASDLDVTALMHEAAAPTEENPPRQTQQETPVKAEPVAVRRTPAQNTQHQPQKKAKRLKEEIIEEKERGAKFGIVVIALCSLVTLAAIGIFLVTLFGGDGGGFTTNENTVSIPNMLGKNYEQIKDDSADYSVEIDHYAYSDEYAEGEIISQNPNHGNRVVKGTVVKVVVSVGPEPSVKKMVSLVGSDLDQAVNYLVNTQNISEDRILYYYEYSTDVKEGLIIRTDPMDGEELPEDCTINLYISSGPAVKKVTMVDLTADIYNENSACNWLDMNGFNNYEIEYVDSAKPAGKVVSQSVSAGTSMDVTDHLVLQISNGEGTQQGGSSGGSDAPVPETTKLVEISLPDDILEDYTLWIYKGGDLIEERLIPAGAIFTEFNLSGEGVETFIVELSTGVSWSIQVNFDAEEIPEVPEDEVTE